MVEAATGRRSRITPERESELYLAVLDLLGEVGYEALTMDTVAARTRSSKATLYRQWGGKAELVVRALRHNKPLGVDRVGGIDTGTLRGDLHALHDQQDVCEFERSSALMRGLATAVHHNPDLRQALCELLIDPELAELRKMLQRAVDRGEIRPDNPAKDYVLHMLVGAIGTRALIDELPPDQQFLHSYIEAVVLPALGA
ncbi:Transcriptional regulator, TetR family [Streptomyces sp. YIM 130001]|uniref:TetR/AcrR family transcriptional regulator n=1 Tax=Streptomyces sp. YIM 130001 TaxID=2259644 RepID=UPI000E6479A1|nr:TetR/AcrR family transcriptional regulator [Streptomyces sp. YIM 130001]RII22236.1 Transcriptional regulator, TetR family [Streptomyces sp. YIM 130001]